MKTYQAKKDEIKRNWFLIDADGLNNLAADPDCLKSAAGPRLLTPHPGEMARLVGAPLPALRVDLVTMTGNVAQVFLSDDDWMTVLRSAYAALRPGGPSGSGLAASTGRRRR